MISKECKLTKVSFGDSDTYKLEFEGLEDSIDLSESDTNKIKSLFDALISGMIEVEGFYKFDFIDSVGEGDSVFYKSGLKYIEQLNNDLEQIFCDYSEQFNFEE